jgi:hypothetical protein
MKNISEKLFFILVLSAAYYFTTVWFELTYEFRGAPWRELTAQIAQTPFQYRTLIPSLVNILSKLIPLAPSVLYFWISFIIVILLIYALRSYLTLFIETPLSSFFAFGAYLVLPYTYILNRSLALRYPSDLPSVLFFTVGLILLYKKNWRLFYPLYIIATFNRETSCYLTAAYLCTAIGYEDKKRILFHVKIQAITWLAVKYVLYLIYRTSAGHGFFQLKLKDNIDFFLAPHAYPLLLSALGYLWIPSLVFWRYIPAPFVRRTILLIPLFFLGMFLVGNMWEIRIYGELTPVVISACALIITELCRKKISFVDSVNFNGQER